MLALKHASRRNEFASVSSTDAACHSCQLALCHSSWACNPMNLRRAEYEHHWKPNYIVSWMIIPNIWEKWKMFQTTNQWWDCQNASLDLCWVFPKTHQSLQNCMSTLEHPPWHLSCCSEDASRPEACFSGDPGMQLAQQWQYSRVISASKVSSWWSWWSLLDRISALIIS